MEIMDKPVLYGNIENIEPVTIDIGANSYILVPISEEESIREIGLPNTGEPVRCGTITISTFDFSDHFPWIYGEFQEVLYGDDMPGMTLEEFQKWSDDLISEIINEEEEP